MVTWFAGEVFALGPDALAEGIRWIGSTDHKQAIPSRPRGAERAEGPGRIPRFFKAVVKDLCDCKERSGRAWGSGCLQAVPGMWVSGYVVGAAGELEREMD